MLDIAEWIIRVRARRWRNGLQGRRGKENGKHGSSFHNINTRTIKLKPHISVPKSNKHWIHLSIICLNVRQCARKSPPLSRRPSCTIRSVLSFCPAGIRSCNENGRIGIDARWLVSQAIILSRHRLIKKIWGSGVKRLTKENIDIKLSTYLLVLRIRPALQWSSLSL